VTEGGLLDLMTRPLRQWRDYGGRATRSELIAFSILAQFLGHLIETGLVAATRLDESAWPIRLAVLVLLPPLASLSVRRLHDSGRSGWWLLLVLPLVAYEIFWGGHSGGTQSWIEHPLLEIGGGLLVLAFWVLLLWEDDPETNRYGPNPRVPATPERLQDSAPDGSAATRAAS
jgi:uncharacterized membrane protein YhaH (DUF805 family)